MLQIYSSDSISLASNFLGDEKYNEWNLSPI